MVLLKYRLKKENGKGYGRWIYQEHPTIASARKTQRFIGGSGQTEIKTWRKTAKKKRRNNYGGGGFDNWF